MRAAIDQPVLLLALTLFASGCAQQNVAPPDAAVEASVDLRPDTQGCEPGCHWDCFGGGVGCIQGAVWVYGGGTIPCCHSGDPIPGEGPAGPCAGPKPAHVCASRRCTSTPDPRYATCGATSPQIPLWGFDFDIYYRVHCAGIARRAGDLCSSDNDCRPSAGDARLRCALPAGRCVQTPRPKAPPGYGQSCGLTSWNNQEVVWDFPRRRRDLPLCHVARDGYEPNACVRQGLTMLCVLDEDCPVGSICLCETYPLPVCARATDRTSYEGRTAGLRCF